MGSGNGRGGRTLPFPGFSRGLPIVGARPEMPPEGRYYYHVPILISRPGAPLEADSYEANFPLPIEGVQLLALVRDIEASLKGAAPDLAAPRVVPLTPFLLGFIPQSEIEKAEAKIAERKEETHEPAS